VALANLDLFERERLNDHVRDREAAFRAALDKLRDIPIVGDVRGDGFFLALELVQDRETRTTLDAGQRARLMRDFLPAALFEAGLYCRVDDRAGALVQLAPPLVCDRTQFDEIEQILRDVLTRASDRM
jgi:adenosylmethionine-8-amino-7-oxononanoate aminotransferase